MWIFFLLRMEVEEKIHDKWKVLEFQLPSLTPKGT